MLRPYLGIKSDWLYFSKKGSPILNHLPEKSWFRDALSWQ